MFFFFEKPPHLNGFARFKTLDKTEIIFNVTLGGFFSKRKLFRKLRMQKAFGKLNALFRIDFTLSRNQHVFSALFDGFLVQSNAVKLHDTLTHSPYFMHIMSI